MSFPKNFAPCNIFGDPSATPMLAGNEAMQSKLAPKKVIEDKVADVAQTLLSQLSRAQPTQSAPLPSLKERASVPKLAPAETDRRIAADFNPLLKPTTSANAGLSLSSLSQPTAKPVVQAKLDRKATSEYKREAAALKDFYGSTPKELFSELKTSYDKLDSSVKTMQKDNTMQGTKSPVLNPAVDESNATIVHTAFADMKSPAQGAVKVPIQDPKNSNQNVDAPLHANMLKLHDGSQCILTQVPTTSHTRELFYKNAALQPGNLIIDTTNGNDIKKTPQISQIYPKLGATSANGSMTMKCTSEKTDGDIVISTYEVQEYKLDDKGKPTKDPLGNPKTVTRINFSGWEDFSGVDSKKLAGLIDAIDSHAKPGDVPIFHCRAGVGRSGTLATAWNMAHQIRDGKLTTPKAALKEMNASILDGRKDRGPYFVQTEEQLHDLMRFVGSKFEQRNTAFFKTCSDNMVAEALLTSTSIDPLKGKDAKTLLKELQTSNKTPFLIWERAEGSYGIRVAQFEKPYIITKGQDLAKCVQILVGNEKFIKDHASHITTSMEEAKLLVDPSYNHVPETYSYDGEEYTVQEPEDAYNESGVYAFCPASDKPGFYTVIIDGEIEKPSYIQNLKEIPRLLNARQEKIIAEFNTRIPYHTETPLREKIIDIFSAKCENTGIELVTSEQIDLNFLRFFRENGKVYSECKIDYYASLPDEELNSYTNYTAIERFEVPPEVLPKEYNDLTKELKALSGKT